MNQAAKIRKRVELSFTSANIFFRLPFFLRYVSLAEKNLGPTAKNLNEIFSCGAEIF